MLLLSGQSTHILSPRTRRLICFRMAAGSGGKGEAGNLARHGTTTNLVRGGGEDEGGHRQAMKAMFILRALRAPMCDARTGKKYRALSLVQGRIHTFGRSRSSCDVVFSDARVSRQHCQVYWDPVTNQVFLFEGAAAEILIRSGKVTPSPVSLSPGKTKPSMNGLFVDGKKLAQGGCRILNPGSEVSLIARTKEAQPVDDPEFGDAVGFFVDVVDLCQQNSFRQPNSAAQVDMGRPRMVPKFNQSERVCLPLPTYRRKRPLANHKQGTWKVTDERSSLSFERRWTSSSTASVRKKPKRSTAEIMGLLRRQPASSAVTNAKTDHGLREGNPILRGPEQNLDRMERAAKISCRSDSTFQNKEQLLEGSPTSRVVNGEGVTPVNVVSDDFSTVPNSEKETPPEGRCSVIKISNASLSSGRVMSGPLPRGEVEEDQGTLEDFGRNVMGPAHENISLADTGTFSGKCCGSGFLLNRLKDLEPTLQESSQQTVSLQELLNPTDDLLGIFVATFTSDILWFLSSHKISPELPVTVACHDHDRCWSTAAESRTSTPSASWPNVSVVYPVFPDSCCFATEKRQGIGCHHPKIFLLPRKNSIRVIVTSANLTRVQWLHVTNSVWWQDFPRRPVRDYETLFCTSGVDKTGPVPKHTQSDFAMHLSSFVASLVADVPSAAHWALDLAEFDFSNAAASLVTSIPGLYGCPCPPVPESVWDALKQDLIATDDGVRRSRKFLATVSSSVVGVSHRFKDSADPRGERIRALASVLHNSTDLQEGGVLTVKLERITNLTADPNAVSVIVYSETASGPTEMGIGKDLLQMMGNSLSSAPRSSVHIGFLPRTVAKWVAPLFDTGLCTFAACIRPSEVIGLANGFSKKVAQLLLYVFEGPTFSRLPASDLSLDHKAALCGLLRNMERPLGLWRVRQILSKFNWLDAAETNFIFGSSSIGTSLDAAFLAAFSVAAGKKAFSSAMSDESDSQWGAWTAEHEANAPSVGVVFPTIERVTAAKGGPFRHQALLCFAESTWERLKTACVLHDAIPFPAEREGIPMHVKVAQRRFLNHPGEAPYGWIYCGSHNFSPAAWGRPHTKAIHPCKCRKTALGCSLLISNYEVGLIFVEPPPDEASRPIQFKPLSQNPNLSETKKELKLDNRKLGLDKYVLPFCVPAPKYADVDKPATKRAMYGAMERWRSKQSPAESGSSEDSDVEMASSEPEDELEESQLAQESEASVQLEEEYGGLLWSQIDPHMPPQ